MKDTKKEQPVKVIDRTFHHMNQSHYLNSILQVTQGTTAHKLKVHIRRNAYDFQSEATVKIWNQATLSWNFVASLPYNGEEKAATFNCSYIDPITRFQPLALQDETRLIKKATAVIF